MAEAAQTGDECETLQAKRTSYIEWEEYFMAVALLSAKRSKDPCTQVGACIVNNEKKIVGIGYNGMPRGCDDNQFPWNKGPKDSLDAKSLYVCHAELNAVLNKNSSDVKDCTIYVTLFPCNECAKVIIQSGIKSIVYLSDEKAKKFRTIAAKKMFNAAGVSYRPYSSRNEKIEINFETKICNETDKDSSKTPTNCKVEDEIGEE